MAAPIAARADPEPRQQILLANLLGFFRRQFGIGLDDLWRRRFDMVAVLGDDLDDLRLLTRFFVVAWLLCVARLFIAGFLSSRGVASLAFLRLPDLVLVSDPAISR